jgi:hypothetical protein
MSRSAYPLKLPVSIKRAAERLAKEDGVSLNQWIAVAVAQKVGVIETAAEFFARRKGNIDRRRMMGFLRSAPDREPESNDALPRRSKRVKLPAR